MPTGISFPIVAAIALGIILLVVLHHLQTIRRRRTLAARLARIHRRHGF